ncbi:MAG TPA: transcriptional repressor [Mucilaginibacter sp.]|jgi:Fur family ferric uptake transcriptional regulator|nr:transcriptional repressor [Mucilaginibacter sp.]
MRKVDEKVDARTLLENFGLKITTARLKVLSAIISIGPAVSIRSIKRRTKGISRITLYKTLKTLEKKGAIYKLFDLSGTVYYALSRFSASKQFPVYTHFNCPDCRKMLESPPQEIFTISLPKGFKARMLALFVWGKCGICRKKIPN